MAKSAAGCVSSCRGVTMQVPNIPTPDEFFKHLLIAVFGQGAAIVGLYVLVYSVWSWYSAGQFTIKTIGKGIETGRRVHGRLFELGPVGAVLGFVISVVVLVLQTIWIGLSYLIGNGLSWFFIGGRSGMRNGPDWKAFIADLRWDWVSGVYVAGAVVVLLLAYQAAFYADWEETAKRAMTILTAPLVFVGVLSGLGAALAGVVFIMYSISHQHDAFAKDFGLKALALAVIAATYIVASRTIARTPALIAGVWRPVGEYDTEQASNPYPYPGYPHRVWRPRRAGTTAMIAIGLASLVILGIGLGRKDSNPITRSSASSATPAAHSTFAASKLKNHKPGSPALPPLHTRLICNTLGGDSGVVCGASLQWVDVLALSVQGLTQNVVNRLCAEGYKSKWSQNMGGYIRNPTMCPGSNISVLDGPDFPNGKMTVYFEPPTRNGRWVIVWRLYDHLHHLVRLSHYKVRVVS